MASAPISEHEAALYDRQIRLWGLDAQQRLRATNVLIIGIKGVTAEIVKNIVLAGAGNVTIVDETKVTAADLGANFFLTKDDIDKPRSQAILPRVCDLNPLVNVLVSDKDFTQADHSIAGFNVVVATDLSLSLAMKLDEKCRRASIPFVLATSYGIYSFAFIDADKHRYYEMRQEHVEPSKKRSAPDSEVEKKEVRVDSIVSSPSLQTALELSWNDSSLGSGVSPLFFAIQVLDAAQQNTQVGDLLAHMKKLRADKLAASKATLKQFDEAFLETFYRNSKAEISAVCAIVGGIIGQEVIKLITAKDEPLKNFFFYDGWQDSGQAVVIPAKVEKVQAPIVTLDLSE